MIWNVSISINHKIYTFFLSNFQWFLIDKKMKLFIEIPYMYWLLTLSYDYIHAVKQVILKVKFKEVKIVLL